MNWFEKALLEAKPVKQERVTIKGRSYPVRYIEPAVMERATSYGCAYQSTIFIRSDLPNRIRQFVIRHEAYHIEDKHDWLGWFGGELRANIASGIHDPIGLLLTIKASLNRPRLKAYWGALAHKGWWRES
jgi:hypothetical protein